MCMDMYSYVYVKEFDYGIWGIDTNMCKFLYTFYKDSCAHESFYDMKGGTSAIQKHTHTYTRKHTHAYAHTQIRNKFTHLQTQVRA